MLLCMHVDALFFQPVFSMIGIVFQFLYELRKKNVDTVIFETVRPPPFPHFYSTLSEKGISVMVDPQSNTIGGRAVDEHGDMRSPGSPKKGDKDGKTSRVHLDPAEIISPSHILQQT